MYCRVIFHVLLACTMGLDLEHNPADCEETQTHQNHRNDVIKNSDTLSEL